MSTHRRPQEKIARKVETAKAKAKPKPTSKAEAPPRGTYRTTAMRPARK